MQKLPIDDRLLTNYLLGASPETDTERLDELSVTDDTFIDRLRVIEDDLVDSYVRGELTGDSLNRFNSHYLASAQRREKVKVAQDLLTYTDKAAATAAVKTVRRPVPAPEEKLERRTIAGFFGFPRLALQWGFAAAAVLFLITAGYLAYQNLQLRNQITETQQERTALEQREQTLKRQLETQQTSDKATQEELAQVRERLAQLEQQQGNNQREKPIIVAFALSPQTRGVGRIPEIKLPLEADSLALKLDLEATGFQSYEVAVKSPANGQIIWRSGRLKAPGSFLRLTVPAKLLKAQNYVLELSGIRAAAQTEIVGTYPFRIHRSG